MKRCPKCGTDYEEQYKFCPVDATALPAPAGPAHDGLGVAVPTRGWTQMIAAVTEPPAAPEAAPPAAPVDIGQAVPTRGWTQVFAAVDAMDAPAAASTATAAPEPEAPAAVTLPVGGGGHGGPVRGFTQAFAAIESLDEPAPPSAASVPTADTSPETASARAIQASTPAAGSSRSWLLVAAGALAIGLGFFLVAQALLK